MDLGIQKPYFSCVHGLLMLHHTKNKTFGSRHKGNIPGVSKKMPPKLKFVCFKFFSSFFSNF